MTTSKHVLFRVIPIGVAGIVSISYLVNHIDKETVFGMLPQFFLACGSVFAIVWTFLLDRKEHRKSKKKVEFLPSFVGLVWVLMFGVMLFIFKLRDRSPSKLYCVTAICDFNGMSIDFRQDGTYKLSNWCMGVENFRGKYQIKDSIVTLDGPDVAKMIGSDRLLYSVDTSWSSTDTFFTRTLHQVDNKGAKIRDANYFVVK